MHMSGENSSQLCDFTCFNKHGAILFLKYLVLLIMIILTLLTAKGLSYQCVSVSTCVRTELSSEE